MTRALLIAALLLALPGSASAAPFGELPFRPLSGTATCLRATGAPGELVRWVAGGAEVLQARPDGLAPIATVALGKLRDCPAAAADASGAGVLAGATTTGVRIALREPGGAWGPEITFGAKPGYGVEAAISARGDAVVAWLESTSSTTVRVLAVRRPAGGAFGAPEQIGGVVRFEELTAAIAGDGEAFVAIAAENGLWLATAKPGLPFAPASQLLSDRFFSGEVGLAAAADGRALLATTTDDGLVLFEREPGADFVRRPAIGAVGSSASIAVALHPQGAAVVAWQDGGPGGAVSAMIRAGVAAFGAPVLVQRDEQPPRLENEPILSFVAVGDGPPYEGETRLRAALGADGRALLAWGTEGRGARTATVTPAGRTELGRLGGAVLDPAGVTPLFLAGGTRAIAWSDGYDLLSTDATANRLHLAIEGASESPAAAAPELIAGAPRDRTLRPAQTLVLPVRCRAACDIRAVIAGQGPGKTVSLAHAGTALLRFEPLSSPLAPARGKSLRVALSWSAPGSRDVKRRTVALALTRLPAPPLPRIEHLRARRLEGGRVDVRWSTDVATRDAYFYVFGSRSGSSNARPLSLRVVNGRGRRGFHATLKDAAGARYVRVAVAQRVGDRTRTAVVRVS